MARVPLTTSLKGNGKMVVTQVLPEGPILKSFDHQGVFKANVLLQKELFTWLGAAICRFEHLIMFESFV